MDTLSKKTIHTTRGFKYTYYVSPASSGKPTILLLHGWPDHAALWEDLVTRHLVPAGFGVVVPDCLGYDVLGTTYIGTQNPKPASDILSFLARVAGREGTVLT